jgi:hypothetical protein
MGLTTIMMACCANIDRASPELLALIDVHKVNDAEGKFRTVMGHYGDLRELGPNGARLVPLELANGVHHSYRFSLSASTTHYAIRARPMRWGEDASRSFYSDETGVIRQNTTNSEATAESKPVY